MAATATPRPQNPTPPKRQPETSRSRAWPAPARNNMPLIDDYRTDDVLVITGFKIPAH